MSISQKPYIFYDTPLLSDVGHIKTIISSLMNETSTNTSLNRNSIISSQIIFSFVALVIHTVTRVPRCSSKAVKRAAFSRRNTLIILRVYDHNFTSFISLYGQVVTVEEGMIQTLNVYLMNINQISNVEL